jgi:hypothetical protein
MLAGASADEPGRGVANRNTTRGEGHRMTVNILKAIIALAGLLICAARAHADPPCDNGSLQGT